MYGSNQRILICYETEATNPVLHHSLKRIRAFWLRLLLPHLVGTNHVVIVRYH